MPIVFLLLLACLWRRNGCCGASGVWYERALLLCAAVAALPAHAQRTYYVTVAGLGGEPDYEQRFTATAKDLDKVFKDSGKSAHMSTR